MFSGIVETKSKVCTFSQSQDGYGLTIDRPTSFDDVRRGDSIAVDGVCLTVDALTLSELSFSVGSETLAVTDWSKRLVSGKLLNLERSMRFGDRVHGHLVTGHVDGLGTVVEIHQIRGGSLNLVVCVPGPLLTFVWKKGSIAINGVSLTVNEIKNETIGLGLIPETRLRTNLCDLRPGEQVHIETDYMAKALTQSASLFSRGDKNGQH